MEQGKVIYEKYKKQIEQYLEQFGEEDVWFRGEGRNFPKMVPSIYRAILSAHDIKKSPRKRLGHGEKLKVVEAERKLKTKIEEEYQYRHGDGYIHQPIQDWGIAYFSQHYGIPTRFLDWTTSLDTALFFATSNNGENEGRIWMLNPKSLNNISRDEYEVKCPNRGEYTRFLEDSIKNKNNIYPIAINAPDNGVNWRMEKQSGTFVYMGLEYIDFRTFVYDYAHNKEVSPTDVLKAIRISSEDCKLLNDYLNSVGTNAESLELHEDNHFANRITNGIFKV